MTVTRVIIAMAHQLNISVIAKGVETAEQLRLVELAQCDAAQGYYLAPPVAAAGLEDVLVTTERQVSGDRATLS